MIQSIFNKELKREVDEIHETFPKLKGKTPFHYILEPHNKVLEDDAKDRAMRLAIKSLKDGKEFIATDANASYQLVSAKYVAARLERIRLADESAFLFRNVDNIQVRDVVRISMLGKTPMDVFWLKHMMLEHFTEEQKMQYAGLQPYTSPVDAITKVLYKHSHTQIEHSMECYHIAKLIGWDTLSVNTAFWILGMRL